MTNLFKNENLTKTGYSVLWNQAIASGLGDRLINTIFVLTICRKLNSSLYFQWLPNMVPIPTDTKFREEDILLDNMLSKINFPQDLNILPIGGFAEITNELLCPEYQFCVDSCEFFNVYGYQFFNSLEEFQKEAVNTARDFKFKNKITVPENLVSIHIRRSDKVVPRDVGADQFMIAEDELKTLNTLTIDWINKLSKTHKTFYICGEQDSSTEWFKQYINNNGLFLFTPDTEKSGSWQRTYDDLQIMSNSKIILQSQRNSSFSRLASFIGGNKLINVFSGEDICK
jgi:hypothetical protein